MGFRSFAIATMLCAASIQSQALAEATIAVARPTADRNISMGIGYNAASRSDADERALSECRESELDALLAGELSAEDAERVRAHAAACATCTRSLAWQKLERGWMAQRAKDSRTRERHW